MSVTFNEDMNFKGLLDQCDNLSQFSGLSSMATLVHAANQPEKSNYRSARMSVNDCYAGVANESC